MKNSIFLITLLLLTISCSKKDEIQHLDTTSLSTEELKEKAIQYLEEDGYLIDDLEITEEGVIIQGDIFSTFENIVHQFDHNHGIPHAKQYRHDRIANISFGGRGGGPIAFKVWPVGLNSELNQALDIAIARFNAVSNSNLRFVKRCQSSRIGCRGDVNVTRNDNLGSNVLGRAGFPTTLPRVSSRGKIYNSIQLNVKLIEDLNYSVDAMATLIAHELGHCVGLRHTDWFARVCDNGWNI